MPTVDCARWPSKENFAAKLKEYYDIEQRMRQAENQISADDREAAGLGR